MLKKMSNWVQYVFVSYLLFWAMVLVLGGSAAMVFKVSPVTMRLIALLCSWAPTIAFIMLYKKIVPHESFSSFIKRNFSPRLKPWLAMASGGAVIIAFLISVFVLSLIKGADFTTFFSLKGYTLIAAILFSVFAGPTGEELGWRGYLRVELDQKYSFIKASIVGGVIWAFWHTILWLIDGEFTGIGLLLYILSNVVVMTSLVVIMNVVLKRSGNLLNAVWIHLCFNFPYSLLQNDSIEFYIIITVVYPLMAMLFLKYHYSSNYERGKDENC